MPRGIFIFRRGGGALLDHLRNPKIHRDCESGCPGYPWFIQGNEPHLDDDVVLPLELADWTKWGCSLLQLRPNWAQEIQADLEWCKENDGRVISTGSGGDGRNDVGRGLSDGYRGSRRSQGKRPRRHDKQVLQTEGPQVDQEKMVPRRRKRQEEEHEEMHERQSSRQRTRKNGNGDGPSSIYQDSPPVPHHAFTPSPLLPPLPLSPTSYPPLLYPDVSVPNVDSTFRILFVDLSAYRGPFQADNYGAFGQLTCNARLEQISDAIKRKHPTLLYKEKDTMGNVKISCWSMLFLPILIEHSTGASVQYWAWENFRDAVLMGAGEEWGELEGYNLIIGGLDLTADFMDEQVSGLSATEACTYIRNSVHLSKRVPIWPPPLDLLYQGAKITTISDLAEVSRLHDLAPYPAVATVDTPQLNRPDLVFKRAYSDTTTHVLHRHTNKTKAKALLGSVSRDRLNWSPLRNLSVIPCWFAVPYIPEVVTCGELRAYVLRGEVHYVIWTRPLPDGDIECVAGERLMPLSRLGDLASGAEENWLNPGLCIRKDAIDARRHFDRFVQSIVHGLVEIEERKAQKPNSSSLRIFCRVDVSVYKDPVGEYQYFVNEIERSHTTILFSSYDEASVEGMVLELGHVLIHWAQSRKLL
ncbi:hypothetical protein BDN72DRAFT_900751 [Pluteus cervinus]|uniref:Uncharacterized protein n=1 Tax=Pluteus cervinus TaxID=181527 RepID=A0ACD3AJ17_9AGAR|nr:hypothetical protein BDN72DRAFT_900751 [Pluteus cervinus]